MKKIALVEDNPDNRLLVQAMLGDRYEVIEFETGPEALQGMRGDPPDLALLDISLPGMDGNELLQNMKDETSLASIPAIALTAHAMAGDREKYLAAGFQEYITKPIVDESVLVEAIERLLGTTG